MHMNFGKTLGLGLVALLLVPLARPIRANDQTVNVWVTTDDQTAKLQQQPSIAFSTAADSGPNAIFVDETEQYQIIEGFGASFTDSAAYLLNQKASAAQLNIV